MSPLVCIYSFYFQKIGVIAAIFQGYCFGAPFVMDICATDKVKAGAFAHPAFLNEEHFRNLKRSYFSFYFHCVIINTLIILLGPLLLSCAGVQFQLFVG